MIGPDPEAAEIRAKKGGGPTDKSQAGIQAFIDGIARQHKLKAWTVIGDKWAPESAGGNGE